MNVENQQHGSSSGNGGFEHQDLKAAAIVYFLLGLLAVTVLIQFGLAGLYDFLDKRTAAQQAPVSPLVTNAPTDTRHIPSKYPETAFPNPRLETDERTQLNEIVGTQEQTLNGYGWVDEKAGIVHIPIERAMDLIAQQGLPVRSASASGETTEAKAGAKAGTKTGSKKEKK